MPITYPSEDQLNSAADNIVRIYGELPERSKQIMTSHKAEVLDTYGSKFSPTNLDNLEFNTLEEFSKYDNNHHWMRIFRHPHQVRASFDRTREAFKIMLNEEGGPIGERIERAYNNQKGLGPAFLTAVLQVVYPDKYGVLNGISYRALKKLELISYTDGTASLISNYGKTNDILLDLSKKTNIDLWNIDWILYVIVTDDMELRGYDAGIDEVKWWIEKTRERTHETRGLANSKIGEFTWSPQTNSVGRDVYKNMRKARSGDVVIHLVLDRGGARGNTFAGISMVKKEYESFTIPAGEPWAPDKDEPGYAIELEDYTDIEDVGLDWQFLRDNYAEELGNIHDNYKGLVYRKNLDLTQGAHLTFVPTEFLNVINKAYHEKSGTDLPFYAEAPEISGVPSPSVIDESNIPRNIILHGPVGTGKTLLSWVMAKMIVDNDLKDTDDIEDLIESDLSDKAEGIYKGKYAKNIRMVTFHQSFGYEEFVQGIAPYIDEKTKQIGYKVKDGIFKRFCEDARKKPGENFVLIIDEINRGDISRIFGELITLLEEDKRCAGGENTFSLELLYTDDEKGFCVPDNLYIIGTMNDSDRSIALIDAALRRRFKFFEVKPNLDLIKKWVATEKDDSGYDLSELMKNAIKHINERITQFRSEDFQIGHAFFKELASGTSKPEITAIKVFHYTIIPLLREFFYRDTPTLCDRVLKGHFFKKTGESYILDEAIFGKYDIDAFVRALSKIGE